MAEEQTTTAAPTTAVPAHCTPITVVFSLECHFMQLTSITQGYDREPPRTRPQSADPKGYYRLLELSGKEGTATEEEVKTAFRRLAMKYHPDMQKTEQDKKKNSEIFKRVVTAYQVLRDKTKRSNYDRYGTE